MITGTQLFDFLVAQGVRDSRILVFDSLYVMPTPAWIENELGPAFAKFIGDAGIVGIPDRFDCNKFAKLATAMADVCWSRTSASSEAALAFGLFAYDGHAINVAVHRVQPDQLALGFYEPQPIPTCLTKINLAPDEVANCLSCLFV